MKLVVVDEDKAHEAFINSYHLHPDIQRELRRVNTKRPVGTIHTEFDSLECPEGLPNCRNCGDPEFKETCARDGHCPNCGTNHGIAPDSVLARNGYAIEA
jgi:hypothetical protein